MGRRGLVCSPGSSTLSRLKLPCGTAAIADADATAALAQVRCGDAAVRRGGTVCGTCIGVLSVRGQRLRTLLAISLRLGTSGRPRIHSDGLDGSPAPAD